MASLLARNPFGERTLIPNFEPYPDSFHYIVPVQNLLAGRGFNLDRIGPIRPGVPPLYSLALLPFFVVYNDPRIVYVANVFFSLCSLVFMYCIVSNLTKSGVVRLFAMMLFATHPILIWYPNLAMAENFSLVLTTLGLYLLLIQQTKRTGIIAGFLTIGYYTTKFASFPQSAAYGALYILKTWLTNRKVKSLHLFLSFFLSALVFGTAYLASQYILKGASELDSVLAIFRASPESTEVSIPGSASARQQMDPFFGVTHISKNLPTYVYWLAGSPMTILWKQEFALPQYLAIPSLLGLLFGLATKRFRFIAGSCILLLTSSIAFMSTFYVADARYMYHAIVILIIGFVIACEVLYLVARNYSMLVGVGIVMLLSFYSATNLLRLKFQIGLNLKYAETPWYFVSIKEVDSYLKRTGPYEKEPVIISPTPPFLFDFYAKQPLRLLPLHRMQEFRNAPTQTWGEHDYFNLHAVYTGYLEQGNPVFVSTYGLGNEEFLHQAMEELSKDFSLTEVLNECHTQCKLYSVQLRK